MSNQLEKLIRRDPKIAKVAIQKAAAEKSLAVFIEMMWKFVEPGRGYVHNWHIDCLCLPYDSGIITPEGIKPIGWLVESGYSGSVLSFNHENQCQEWRQVVHRMKNSGQPLYELISSKGDCLHLTGNHPVWVGDKYESAENIRIGDILLRVVQDIVSMRPVSEREVLQSEMLCRGKDRFEQHDMRVWKKKNLGRRALQKVLWKIYAPRQKLFLRSVRERCLQDSRELESNIKKTWGFLQSFMPCLVHEGKKQSSVHRRKESCAVSKGVSSSQKTHLGARFSSLFSLLGSSKKTSGCSPYRSQQRKQRDLESGGTMPSMPYKSAWDGEGNFAIGECHVESIERKVHIPDSVYNIEVEGNNNYFANNILVHNCEHLEAVTAGDIRKLLINIPPGFAKSLVSNVFWPAWIWTQDPHKRFICYSYAHSLTERDNIRFRQVIMSDLYRALWGDVFSDSKDRSTITQVTNDKMGFKLASSVGGVSTGARADILIIDDPNSVKDAESQTVRESTNQWFNEVLPTRINDPRDSCMVTIQQRTNEDDVSGNILTRSSPGEWEHVCLAMEFENTRKCYTSIGWADPRTNEGELLWPEVYSHEIVDRLKKQMGSFASSAQFQQMPSPRGGGIIKSKWWGVYPEDEEFDEDGRPVKPLEYPMMEYIIGSLDSAYTEKQQNDYSAFTVWGIYRHEGRPRIMLMSGWKDRLGLNDLVVKIAETGKRFPMDRILVENKASGISVAQELRRLFSNEKWMVELVEPHGDKVARMYMIQHLFENGIVYAPRRQWADDIIDDVSKFPKGAHDDMPDSVSQAMGWLRRTGWALRKDEYEAEQEVPMFQSVDRPLYDV